MQEFFIAMGITFTLIIIAIILFVIFFFAKMGITYFINRYRVKHRFNKKPLPKCYCIDCKNCQVKEHRGRWCYRFERCVADNWFCWEAEPNIPCEYIKKGES